VAAIAPFVTALPAKNMPININTCSPVLLRILARTPLSESDALALADGRGPLGYLKIEDFLRRPELAGKGDTAVKLAGIASSFFMVSSSARYGRVDTRLLSLVQRGAAGAPAIVIDRLRDVP